MEIFEVKLCNFLVWPGEKKTGNFLSKITPKWERLRTAGSDLYSAKLGFCLKNSIFVSTNWSWLCVVKPTQSVFQCL